MSAVLDLDALEQQANAIGVAEIREKALKYAWFDVTCFACLDRIYGDKAETEARKSQAFKLLRKVHCVRFDAMPNELREAIPALVEAVIAEAATAVKVMKATEQILSAHCVQRTREILGVTP